MKYKLNIPVKWGKEDGEEEVSEIDFNRPKGKHLKRMPAEPTMKDLMILASKVSKYPPAFFDEVDGADIVSISEVMGDFLTVGQVAGQVNGQST